MLTRIGAEQGSEQSKLELYGIGQRLGGNQAQRYGSMTQEESILEEGPTEANQSDQGLVPLGYSGPSWYRK